MTNEFQEDDDSLAMHPITEMMRSAGADSELANRLYMMLRKRLLRKTDAKRKQLGAGDSLEGDFIPYRVFLKLLEQDPESWNDRTHILNCAAQSIGWRISNHQKRKRSIKRGGQARITFLSGSDVRDPHGQDLQAKIVAEETIARLTDADPEIALILDMKYRSRLQHLEIARALGMTVDQVDYRVAKSLRWAEREISSDQ
ncbi:ECF-type sigma factor [Rubripirellula reticaptiva]|uniref:ECF sigma factor n=1 Tax=Rubripirellula reticaptiva TaxID=2528013 RepID=A0A5C6ENI2_9BACT|nr:ECF-type sigma factor [Rubripirellula reticaptiva]TWU49171.1 ECF sigma factor [Rubripirellula reticaptiva]